MVQAAGAGHNSRLTVALQGYSDGQLTTRLNLIKQGGQHQLAGNDQNTKRAWTPLAACCICSVYLGVSQGPSSCWLGECLQSQPGSSHRQEVTARTS